MKRIFAVILGFILLLNAPVKADEGMWLLSLIGKNYEDMKAKGLRLSPQDIYDINNASLKDAIIGLSSSQYFAQGGFFCTGELISDKSLMLTNHHCGYSAIQEHSSVEHDYLKDGFWAKSFDQELMNEDISASILVRMEDVTNKVLADVTDEMTETERNATIEKAKKAIKKEAKGDTHYDIMLKSMFDGNQYFLFVYETFKDVRLVGAPPSSIGKFGGDTDNWMWPRHTGDFCMFRIYTAPDGSPAKPDQKNIPYKPKKYLPVSIKGVEKDDFAMIMGFPGSTQRYMTSYGIEETIESSNPIRIKVRTKKLNILKEDMNSDDAIRIKYAAKYAQSANYWKYSIGQNKGLKRLDVFGKKEELEKRVMTWINANDERKAKYGECLSMIEKSYQDRKANSVAFNYLLEALLQGPEIAMFPASIKFGGFYNTIKNNPDKTELIEQLRTALKEEAEEHFKNYNAPTDKKVLAAMLKMYYENVPKEFHLDIYATIEKKFKGDFDKYADKLFESTVFASKEAYFEFLDNPKAKTLDKDPAYQLMEQVIGKYLSMQGASGHSDDYKKGKRLFVDAYMQMEKEKKFYPNANSSIRLTYGTVGDYKPADAVHYKHYTTTNGILEKEDPSVDEFVVAPRLKELIQKKDFGRYASDDGTVHVCFTTNNDITGGNSGSPVINGNGELIGTAFDGNWEAMSGDIEFEEELQKTIIADIRYVLFVVDKYAGAQNLIDEMTIVE